MSSTKRQRADSSEQTESGPENLQDSVSGPLNDNPPDDHMTAKTEAQGQYTFEELNNDQYLLPCSTDFNSLNRRNIFSSFPEFCKCEQQATTLSAFIASSKESSDDDVQRLFEQYVKV